MKILFTAGAAGLALLLTSTVWGNGADTDHAQKARIQADLEYLASDLVEGNVGDFFATLFSSD